jgi:CTP synthase
MIKLDPYINVDPGTMSPFQHGEVFVTDDGAETDLDLGHYERFVRTRHGQAQATSPPAASTSEVIRKERRGDYLGATVQVIPHITDEIKRCIVLGPPAAFDVAWSRSAARSATSSRCRSSRRSARCGTELGPDHCAVHAPDAGALHRAAGEIKTKPTQHSVKELRSIGIQPDVLLCRSEQPLPDERARKIALFTNVRSARSSRRSTSTTSTRSRCCCTSRASTRHRGRRLRLKAAPPADLSDWRAVVDAKENPERRGRHRDGRQVRRPRRDAYKSLNEALKHGRHPTRTRVKLKWLESEHIEKRGAALLEGVDASWCRAASASAASRARSRRCATRARTASRTSASATACRRRWSSSRATWPGWTGANSTENDRACAASGDRADHRVAHLGGDVERATRPPISAAPCASAQECIKPGTRAREIYGKDVVSERHRHRYEFNNRYRTELEEAGLVISGQIDGRPAGRDDRAADHPWFVACQFHPEFTSTPREGHPLFIGFVRAARERKVGAGKRAGGRLPRKSVHEAADSRSAWTAVLPDRRPCVIESLELQLESPAAARDHLRARHSLHLQVQLRQGQPHLGHQLPRPRPGSGLKVLEK